MPIYGVVIKTPQGEVKEEISAQELSKRHWDKFYSDNDVLGITHELVDSEREENEFRKRLKEFE